MFGRTDCVICMRFVYQVHALHEDGSIEKPNSLKKKHVGTIHK